MIHRNVTAAPPARVVVLGASGFIGGALLPGLRRQHVPVLGLSSRDLDLTSAEAGSRLAAILRADDALVFGSAITRDKGRDVRTMMRNLSMGEHVAAAIQARPCAHVVYYSSDAVYPGDAPNPVSEATACAPTDLYGLMHLVRERMLSDTLAPLGIPLAVLRPSIVYGPDDTHGSYGPNRWMRTIPRGEGMTLFGNGEERRDHVYIDDVVEISRLVLVHRSEGVLNIATGSSHSFADVAAMMASATGESAVHRAPRVMPITHREYDVAALRRSFTDFRPTPLSVGLEHTWTSVSRAEHTC
jgi:nucleoside-diphosphate-sugar epimerase